jgi:hypothetical protein
MFPELLAAAGPARDQQEAAERNRAFLLLVQLDRSGRLLPDDLADTVVTAERVRDAIRQAPIVPAGPGCIDLLCL